MNERCWYRGCDKPGETRPIFAHAHDLAAGLRLCDAHLSEIAHDPDHAAAWVCRPARPGESPRNRD